MWQGPSLQGPVMLRHGLGKTGDHEGRLYGDWSGP